MKHPVQTCIGIVLMVYALVCMGVIMGIALNWIDIADWVRNNPKALTALYTVFTCGAMNHVMCGREFLLGRGA